jgi:hypothetical protein
MAKRSSGNRPGGGPGSRVVVEPRVYYPGKSTVVSPAGVSQIGSSLGDKATNRSKLLPNAVEPVRKGEAVHPVPMGNAVSAATVCGPGGSRQVMASGTQQQYGQPEGRPAPQGRDILRDFGPDFKR